MPQLTPPLFRVGERDGVGLVEMQNSYFTEVRFWGWTGEELIQIKQIIRRWCTWLMVNLGIYYILDLILWFHPRRLRPRTIQYKKTKVRTESTCCFILAAIASPQVRVLLLVGRKVAPRRHLLFGLSSSQGGWCHLGWFTTLSNQSPNLIHQKNVPSLKIYPISYLRCKWVGKSVKL